MNKSGDDYDDQMLFRDRGGINLSDICLIGEEKPRKYLIQEICPDRASNPGPLRSRLACCRLAHSGYHFLYELLTGSTENKSSESFICSKFLILASHAVILNTFKTAAKFEHIAKKARFLESKNIARPAFLAFHWLSCFTEISSFNFEIVWIKGYWDCVLLNFKTDTLITRIFWF